MYGRGSVILFLMDQCSLIPKSTPTCKQQRVIDHEMNIVYTTMPWSYFLCVLRLSVRLIQFYVHRPFITSNVSQRDSHMPMELHPNQPPPPKKTKKKLQEKDWTSSSLVVLQTGLWPSVSWPRLWLGRGPLNADGKGEDGGGGSYVWGCCT